MNEPKNESIIESMKDSLRNRVSEWIGNDIPEKDDEDYARWQSMVSEIEEISDLQDVRSFFEGNGMGDFDDFLMDHEWDVSGLS